MPTCPSRHGSRAFASPAPACPAVRSPIAGQTDFRIAGSHYEVMLDGEWRPVPPDRVLERVDNPTGRAVVCYTPARGIMCFVRGAET